MNDPDTTDSHIFSLSVFPASGSDKFSVAAGDSLVYNCIIALERSYTSSKQSGGQTAEISMKMQEHSQNAFTGLLKWL